MAYGKIILKSESKYLITGPGIEIGNSLEEGALNTWSRRLVPSALSDTLPFLLI
jgi:hypothetical protein